MYLRNLIQISFNHMQCKTYSELVKHIKMHVMGKI